MLQDPCFSLWDYLSDIPSMYLEIFSVSWFVASPCVGHLGQFHASIQGIAVQNILWCHAQPWIHSTLKCFPLCGSTWHASSSLWWGGIHQPEIGWANALKGTSHSCSKVTEATTTAYVLRKLSSSQKSYPCSQTSLKFIIFWIGLKWAWERGYQKPLFNRWLMFIRRLAIDCSSQKECEGNRLASK